MAFLGTFAATGKSTSPRRAKHSCRTRKHEALLFAAKRHILSKIRYISALFRLVFSGKPLAIPL